jgi:hypothetical protein
LIGLFSDASLLVVLDARALSLDGSPHHTPLTPEDLGRYISIVQVSLPAFCQFGCPVLS